MGGALISLAWLANDRAWQAPAGGQRRADWVGHPPAFLPGPAVAKTEFIGHGGTETTFK